MNSEKTPKPLSQETVHAALKADRDMSEADEAALAEEEAVAAAEALAETVALAEDEATAAAAEAALERDNRERRHLQILKSQTILKQMQQFHFWRRLIIPLMVIIPWLLFILTIWVIFRMEDVGFWTKGGFVSGSFVTLVSFYLALVKGLFSNNKERAKSITEQSRQQDDES